MKKNKIPKYIYIIILAGALFVYGYFFRGNEAEKANTNPDTEVPSESVNNQTDMPEVFFGSDFSFNYPSSYEFTEQDDQSGGEVAFFQSDSGSAFQVFIMPFDEEGPMTPERIKKDIPGTKVESPVEIDLGGIKALAFYGRSESVENTFEVWFVNNGKLYQVTGFKESEEFLRNIIKTWEWSE